MSLNISTKKLLAVLGFALCLTAQPSAVTAQSPADGRIVGKLLDRGTGAPLAGEIAASFVSKGKIIFTHARATAAGGFVLDGVEPGKVYLTTKLDGYAVEHRSVSLLPGEAKALELSLIKSALLRGTVRNPAGRPLAGALVKVLYPADTPALGEIRATYQWETGEADTDAQGSFVIPVHPERAFVVEASHPGFLSAISAPRQMKTLGKAAVNLTLESGVTLSGIVNDEKGNAIQGAQVRLIETGARRAVPGFVSHALLEQQLRLSSSGADGAFRFEQVSPTAKTVVILHPRYKPFRQTVDVMGKKAQSPFRAVLRSQN